VRRVGELLNERSRSVKGARVLVLGVAYKRDTGDVRESPALDILRLLEERGARVRYSDPYNPTLRLEDGSEYRSVKLTPTALAGADLVLIVTDHSVFDYDHVVRHSRLVFDTRNATRKVRRGRSKVHTL